MSNYSRILNEFVQKLGCNENDRFSEFGINKALDKLAQTNAGLSEFHRDVSIELFEQTTKNHDGTITLRDFINTLLRAVEILHRQLGETERQLQYSNNPTEKQELQGNYDQFNDDLILINRTFNLPGPTQGNTSRLSNSYGPVRGSRKTEGSMYRDNPSRVSATNNNSGIFATQPSNYEFSTSLMITFFILSIAFVFELLMMFVKSPFMGSLVYIMVFAIYLLNYFDGTYIKACFFSLLGTIFLDIIWLIALAPPFYQNQFSYRSNLQQGYLQFTFVMTIILMFAKAIIAIILFRYRGNTENTRKAVKIFTLRFDLGGKFSPVYYLLNNNKQGQPAGY